MITFEQLKKIAFDIDLISGPWKESKWEGAYFLERVAEVMGIDFDYSAFVNDVEEKQEAIRNK